ncbi:hypothetical protein GCM10023187_45890 [Nibrella viscosa]|uniref:Uncharacterized protein n=1 Tax=Nibrella viscosa TaxID=1084524 RepID=A0ABP8KU41_9BACT
MKNYNLTAVIEGADGFMHHQYMKLLSSNSEQAKEEFVRKCEEVYASHGPIKIGLIYWYVIG